MRIESRTRLKDRFGPLQSEKMAVRILALGISALLVFSAVSMPVENFVHASKPLTFPIELVTEDDSYHAFVATQSGQGSTLPFILNEGQVHSDVAFYVDTFAGRVYVTSDGLTYGLKSTAGNAGMAIKEGFIGAGALQPYGLDQNQAVVNHYAGEQSNWRSQIATFDSVSFGEVWEGITVDVNAAENNVEKVFTVAPGADVKHIQVALQGVTAVSVDSAGQLVLGTDLGEVSLTKPVAFQDIGGQIRYVEVSYVAGHNQYGFSVGSDYDPEHALVIDPLLASTYLGGIDDEGSSPVTGSAHDAGAEMAVDSAGNVYIAGLTSSDDYPVTAGPYGTNAFPLSDVVVSKLDSDLTTLVASTYLAGFSYDEAFAIAVDSSGDVYITGRTNSTDYPTTTDAYDEDFNDGSPVTFDAFVSKLDSDLELVASTYLGGTEQDTAYDITVDSGTVYVVGRTFSVGFPSTPGAYDETFGGGGQSDAFVTALDDDLQGLTGSTFIGGSNDSGFFAIAINSTGYVYATGFTLATNFPIDGGYDTAKSAQNQQDTVIAVFNAGLTSLESSTFHGGGTVSGEHTTPFGIAISPSDGKVYVAGLTMAAGFPTTSGVYDDSHNGDRDAYVSVLSSSLDSLLTSTVIGTANDEIATDMALSSSSVYITISGGGAGYPTTSGAFDEGSNDAFITALDLNLVGLDASTSFGGLNTDILESITIDPSGDVVVAGYTRSVDFPMTSASYDDTKDGVGGAFDFFISKLTSDLSADTTPPSITLISDSPDPFSPNGDSFQDTTTITFTSDEAGTYTVQILDLGLTGGQNITGTMVAGENNVVWDGIGFTTLTVPDGVYSYLIEAKDASGNTGYGGQPPGTHTITVDTAAGAPDIAISTVSDSTPRWDLDLVNVDGTYSGAVAGDCVVLTWGDGSSDSMVVPAGSGMWGFNHIYASANTGLNTITAELKNPCDPPAILKDTDTAAVTVERHATSLVLDPIRDITATTGFTVSGRLMDTDTVPPSEIPGQTITFDGSGATSSLQPALTEGITFSSSGPLNINACSIPSSCDSDTVGIIDPNPADNNVLRLGVGDTITFPASTVEVKLFIQDSGTATFKYIVEEGDGSFQPEADSAGAYPDVAILQIISGYTPIGGDVVPNGIKTITITDVSGSGTIGVAAILTLNPDGLPPQQHAINFEDLAPGPQPDNFTVKPGHYFSTGFAQSTDEDGLEVTAEFGGSPEYEDSDSATQTYNVLANTAGLGGEGSQSPTASSGGSITVLSCGVNSDSDLDAICDNWETSGVTFGTATYQITADGGAAIGQRDIFVEIDCMSGFCPTSTDINAVESAFAAEGFTLHLVLDETALVVRNPLHVWVDTDADLNNDYDNIKKNHFGTVAERNTAGGTLGAGRDYLEAKAQVFRYILFAQNINTDVNTACGPSGQAELGGNDAIVSVGCISGTNKFVNSAQERQGTLMHELGHMLGLRHGGGDDDNCKPNHISVMNYARQMPWSSLSATTAAGSPTEWKVTFSRQDLADLDENGLGEASGVTITSGQWGGITSFKIIWGKPGATPSVLTGSTGTNVNWNNLGAATESAVSQNINKLSSVLGCNTGTTLSILKSYDEWSLIDQSDLNFRDSGSIDGFVYPDPDTIPELTAEVLTGLNAFGNQFQGVQQPINDVSIGDSGISVFNQKSTIPIKFQLFDAQGNIVTSADVTHIKLKVATISSGLPSDGDYTEPESSNPASTGDKFTYDSATQVWEFHLGTKNMAANKQYSIKIIVDLGLPTETLLDHDGDGVTAVFALK
jgi:hypothetical protein